MPRVNKVPYLERQLIRSCLPNLKSPRSEMLEYTLMGTGKQTMRINMVWLNPLEFDIQYGVLQAELRKIR